jgi:hypothetical protein
VIEVVGGAFNHRIQSARWPKVRDRHCIRPVQPQPVSIGHVRVVAHQRCSKCPQYLHSIALGFVLGRTVF